MALLLVCGMAWRWVPGLKNHTENQRLAITRLVYYLLLPALVLQVMWQSQLSMDTVRIAMVAASAILTSMLLAWCYFHWRRTSKPTAGALILAASFANAMYLGLPVLESTLGPWARAVAVQFDYFASTPLFFTLGIWIAAYHGTQSGKARQWRALFFVPAFWAAVAGSLLSFSDWSMPAWLETLTRTLGASVSPLMVIALGMALQLKHIKWSALSLMVPVFLIQLMIMPAVGYSVGSAVGLRDQMFVATVLETAMPCMVIGLVLCDHYQLDTGVYASTVTVSTLLAMITLPLWYALLT